MTNRAPSEKVPGQEEKKRFLVCGFLALTALSCAGQVEPGGGPIDTVPPRIVRTSPDSNAVRVAAQKIELEFSKYVDRRSVEESIFISPYAGDPEFDWSGKEVSMTFPRPFKPNTTYVISVGTDVRDINAGNRMASGYTLAFSTGDSIDNGSISGRVIDENPVGVMIFAYKLNDVNPDTLDPARTKPDFIMQTGTDGRFTLAHLPLARFRLIAVRDQYKNFLYDAQVDQYGVPTGDVTISRVDPGATGIWFRLTQQDTTRPFLSSARAATRRVVLLRFSEALDSLSFAGARISMLDTITGVPQPVLAWYLQAQSPANARVVTAGDLDSAATYRLIVRNVFDRARNPLDTANASSVFSGSNQPDTMKPTVAVRGVPDSTRGVPLDGLLSIDFSEAMVPGPGLLAVSLIDSARKDVAIDVRWQTPVELTVRPRRELMSAAWYSLLLDADSLKDVFGNRLRDSTFRISFQTFDLNTTGVISGKVIDERENLASGAIYLTATSVGMAPVRSRTVVLPRAGAFRIDRLVGGKYAIQAFRDADSSGTYSYGLPFPFRPSERFTVYPDTLKVRARWGIEGVAVRFR